MIKTLFITRSILTNLNFLTLYTKTYYYNTYNLNRSHLSRICGTVIGQTTRNYNHNNEGRGWETTSTSDIHTGPGPDLLEGESDRLYIQRVNRGVDKLSNKKRFTTDVEVHGEVLFGTFPVLLALRAGRRVVHALYIKRSRLEGAVNDPNINQILALADQLKIPVIEKDRRTLEGLSGGRPNQGICLDADRFPIQRLSRTESTAANAGSCSQLWVVLESIYDPMNFGAILRSCYYLGVDGVITVRDKSCPPTPVVSKASAGMMELAPLWMVTSVTDFIQAKKCEGWDIIGTVGTSGKSNPRTVSLSDARLHRNTVLLMGNEGSGLSPDVDVLCDTLITIPARRGLMPDVESLNVSVATGIILHQLLSSRDQPEDKSGDG